MSRGRVSAGWVQASLQRRFIALLLVILFSVSILFLGVVVAVYQQRLQQEHARASLQINRLLQASLENSMLKRDLDGLREVVGRLGQHEDIAGVSILNPDMEIRFSSNPQLIGSRLDSTQVHEALASKVPQTHVVLGPGEVEWLRSINPVPNRQPCGACHGAIEDNPVNGLLLVDYKTAGLKAEARKTAMLLAGLGSVVLLVAGIGVWLALRTIVLKRLEVLSDTTLSLATGKLDARAKVSGNDEISGLAATFNTMAEELAATLSKVNAAEQFLQAVIDAIPDGVRVIDDDFNIVKANAAYCHQLGQAKSDVIGAKCYASSHARKEPCAETLVMCPVVELRKVAVARLKASHKHVHKDGSDLFVEVTAARAELPAEGKVVPCIVESIRDLAEQVKISQEQRLSEIGLLATGVAHEIHNPLSSIELALSSLSESLCGLQAESADVQYLGIAREEIAKCLKVTDGLMRLSEPPQDNRELVRLGKVIPEVLSLLSYQIKQSGVETNLDLTWGMRVLAADSDMRMIVINLVQNAVHAMPSGGQLTITGTRRDGRIELEFKDTGIGISPDHLNKVFLPFWSHRGDDSTGRGLGLSICRAIIERYDGKISVRSTLGVGTCFTVELPCADFEAKEHEQ